MTSPIPAPGDPIRAAASLADPPGVACVATPGDQAAPRQTAPSTGTADAQGARAVPPSVSRSGPGGEGSPPGWPAPALPPRPGPSRLAGRTAWPVDPLPEDLDGHDADFVRDLALACRAVRRGRTCRGDRVRVVGAGRVADLIGRVAALEGALILDRSAADLVFAAGGRSAGLGPAIRAAARGGRVVLLPQPAPLPRLDLAAVAAAEIDLVGCGAPLAEDYEAALALLAFQELVTE